jgi:uncharacterized protein (TIGR03437 family)
MSRCILLCSSLLSALSLSAQSVPNLAVDANAARHPISPWVYGVNNWPDTGLDTMMRLPLGRWGGDDATSFNWQNSIKNNTGDNPWVYENYAVSPGFNSFHEANLRTGTTSLGTISVQDWLPKAARECSFSVAKYGAQKATNPDNLDCGNGILLNGNPVNNDPNDAYVPVTPAFSQQWVQQLVNTYAPANDGGVQFWSMDNEPEWWYDNHLDVYHQYSTYDDVLARNIKWATAVKATDPTALVTGPVPGGWPGMLFSFKDFTSGWSTGPHYQYWANPVDQNAHGGIPWVEYYLQQMQKAEQTGGTRLLDYLDVHAYITPEGLSGTAGDTTMETLRLTSTRALWDPNYIVPIASLPASGDPCDDYSAMCDATGKQVAPQLIRTMAQWVQKNYPGTGLAITEYSWGALNSITGAIAQADLLGIFGRESLDLATLWGEPNPTDPGAFAFAMFLNYDGNGNQFGETSISATSDDTDTLSIYAAQRSDMALTILVLNKTNAPISDSVSLANFTPAGTVQIWQYSSADLSKILPGSETISGNTISATFPAYSMTLFIVPQSQSVMTAPQPVINWVKNAASWDATAIAPGEIVAIQGTNVGTSQFALGQAGTKLATSVSGVRVLFNGVPAPMLYTIPISGNTQQLAAIVPYEVLANPSATSVNVQVEVQGNRSDPFPMKVALADPGIFTNNFSGQGQAAAFNVNGSTLTRNGSSNPVARGQSIQILATGEGLTSPPGVDGRITTTVAPAPEFSCSLLIGGVTVTPTSCTENPNNVTGELQVTAVVPMNVTPGNAVPVQLTIAGITSPAGVTIAVQ